MIGQIVANVQNALSFTPPQEEEEDTVMADNAAVKQLFNKLPLSFIQPNGEKLHGHRISF